VLRLAPLVHARSYGKHHTLLRGGENAGVVHIICRGTVRVVHALGEYDELVGYGANAVSLPGERLHPSLLGGKARTIELALLGTFGGSPCMQMQARALFQPLCARTKHRFKGANRPLNRALVAGPGDLVGELSCAERVPSRWTAVCATDVDAFVLLRDDFRKWLWSVHALKKLAQERDQLYASRAARGISSLQAFKPDTHKERNIARHELEHVLPPSLAAMPDVSPRRKALNRPAAPDFKLIGGPNAEPVSGFPPEAPPRLHHAAMKQVANRNVWGFGWEIARGRFATPAEIPSPRL
jgi:CRP-like cAMP-binding protein